MRKELQTEVDRQQRKADIAFTIMLFATMPVLIALILTWPL